MLAADLLQWRSLFVPRKKKKMKHPRIPHWFQRPPRLLPPVRFPRPPHPALRPFSFTPIRNPSSISRRIPMSFLGFSFHAGGRVALHHLVTPAPVPRLVLLSTSRIVDFNSRSPVLKFRVNAIHQETKVGKGPSSTNNDHSLERWKIKMLYDGECPLCMREVNFLRKRDEKYGAVKFVDISSNDYSPEENQGLDYKTVMGKIHAILSDGTVVKDVEAFQRLYEEVGLGWIYAITKYEPVATIAGAVYDVWARYRLQITGRPSIDEIMELRKKSGKSCGDSESCKM